MTADRKDRKVLESYFFDLYGVFMKKLSVFVLNAESTDSEAVTLHAILQEMTKTRRLLRTKLSASCASTERAQDSIGS